MSKNCLIRQILLFGLGTLVISGSIFSVSKSKPIKTTQAYVGYSPSTLPTTIYLDDCEADEVRDYYSALNSLGESERKGTNLLKNLKPILKENQVYFSYDGSGGDAVWQAYEIVDRDWEKSPANDPNTLDGIYDPVNNCITNYVYHSNGTHYDNPKNPYIRALYVNRDYDNPMKAFSQVFGNTSGDNPHGNHAHQQAWGGFNQEHIWAKSHGFDKKTTSNGGHGGARGDLMHLWPGDGRTNLMHSNLCFGFVNKSLSYDKVYEKTGGPLLDYAEGNIKGTSKTLGSGTVFEPQDSDKGDIARALFYMAARYNNYANELTGIDSNDPNLYLSDEYVSNNDTGESTATSPVNMGILSDLLAWNKLDPVDEYEIHRNNLLFNNYSKNRNPFIDFPEWADVIWGNASKAASPLVDTVSLKEGQVETIHVESVSLNKTSIEIKVGKTEQLTCTVLPTTANNRNVIWNSENNAVATVNNGLVTAVGEGTTRVSVKTQDGNFVASCQVSVTLPAVVSLTVSGDYYDIYEMGTEFDPDGIIVTASYEDGSRASIPLTDVTFSELDTSKIGEKIITVSFRGVSTTFSVKVVPAPMFGCLGSLGASSFLIAICSAIGLALVIRRKRIIFNGR